MTIKTLILGQIPDDFSPAKHIPLDPFCFIGKENVYPNWENIDFPSNVIKDGKQLKLWDDVTNCYMKSLIAEYTIIFNKKFNLNYSCNFWFRILNTYFSILVHGLYYREHQLSKFINSHRHEAFKVQLISDNIQWNFGTIDEFITSASTNSLFNEWCYSRILEKILPKNWEANYVDKSSLNVASTSNEIKTWKSKLKERVFRRCNDIYGFSFIDCIIFELLLKIKPAVKFDKDFNNTFIENRKELLSTNIHTIISKTLPQSIVNCPKQIEKLSKKRFKKGKINLGSQLLYFNDCHKIKNALKDEAGEITIGVQHGGHNYGTSKTMHAIANAEYTNYVFLSWGYQHQENYQNLVPLPSPLLSRFINKHKQKNNDIILVGTRALSYLFRFEASPISNQCVDYRKGKLNFINNLDKDLFKDFYYRPYFTDNGTFLDKKHYEKRISNLKFNNTKNFHKELINIKLLVLDHPGTTMNIAFIANVPTIFFWEKDFFPLCRQAIPYFEELEKVKILFTGNDYAVNAAKHVNEIANNVQEWWQQKEVQNAKNNWNQNYALASRNWRWKWLKYLWSL